MGKTLTLKFKNQTFQTEAARAVTDVFAGQPSAEVDAYRHDAGAPAPKPMPGAEDELLEAIGFHNRPIALSGEQVLENIRRIQHDAGLRPSEDIDMTDLRLTIEMETGTGKTYTYIKTMYELNRRYGWTKFIIIVPSVAIREGVRSALRATDEHFAAEYDRRIESFVYDSDKPDKIGSFAFGSGMRVMIITQQAFAVRSEAARRIYVAQDAFRTRRPIDVIAAMRPIVIIDEPQSVLGASQGNVTRTKLREFRPLFTLLYSATHRPEDVVNMVFRLDAMDAYNRKLVKRISVKGITRVGTSATDGYVYLERIELTPSGPRAMLGFDRRGRSGVRPTTQYVTDGADLYALSGELEEYREGYRVERIDGYERTVRLLNGTVLAEGDIAGRTDDLHVRRHQIRETILSHIAKERCLYGMGIKCLSLFFIDQVDHYRRYGEEDPRGEYARMFEEEYAAIVDSLQAETDDERAYIGYLRRFAAAEVHNGYFSRDRKGRFVQPGKTEMKNGSNDAAAYDLIMRDKERLLSLEEPTRFVFSHSTLKEGWDNPNVFQICTLKNSDSQTKKRQEVGRGMRLCVNDRGERQDESVLHGRVFDVNELTVIASESYATFAASLQTEIAEAIASRPKKVRPELFVGLAVADARGDIRTLTDDDAQELIVQLRMRNYITKEGVLTPEYHDAKREGRLDLGEEYATGLDTIVGRLETVFDPERTKPDDARGRREQRFDETKFRSKTFQALWQKINRKSYYSVSFHTEDLVHKAVATLDGKLRVSVVYIDIASGTLRKIESREQLEAGQAMEATESATRSVPATAGGGVRYDLVGKLVERTGLTRRVVVEILQGIHPDTFALFRRNPEEFILKAGNLINECKAAVVEENIEYHGTDSTFGDDIFRSSLRKGRPGDDAILSSKSLYDLVVIDSKGIEKKFATALEQKEEVVVYTKLPGGFYINTPMGHYNPDWAIVFEQRSDIKRIYFVAETKGYSDDEQNNARGSERTKIECARRHFAAIASQDITYGVVNSYIELLNDVRRPV